MLIARASCFDIDSDVHVDCLRQLSCFDVDSDVDVDCNRSAVLMLTLILMLTATAQLF